MNRPRLKISPRARDWMLAMGGKFHVLETSLPASRGMIPAAVCRVGAPSEGGEWDALSSAGVTVWCSENEQFAGGKVVIDLYSVGMAAVPVVLTALLNSTCGGGCANCAAHCAARRDEYEPDDDE